MDQTYTAAASSTLKRRPSTGEGHVSPPRKKTKAVATASINESAVKQFFTPISQKSQKAKAEGNCGEHDGPLLVSYRKEQEFRDGIAKAERTNCSIFGFDLDGTIIKSRSGRAFARDASDWQWWHSCVPVRLRALHNEGHHIVIFTNQGWNGNNHKAVRDFKTRILQVLEILDIPIVVYAARQRDHYRKPRTRMWDKCLVDHFEGGAKVDRDVSLFVGDLAGRLRKNGTPQDRSCSDRDFAANIAIPFSTPEEFFLDEEPASWRRQFDPTTYINRSIGAQPQLTLLDQPSPEIVLFCGSPGAGKSTFFQQAFAPSGYRRINQDTLKTRENCIKAARAILAESLSVVIDNTNANIETRRHWVDLARSHGVPIRCIHFTAPIELAKHNAAVRSGGGPLMNPEQRTALPDIAFVDYVKRFQAPDLNEGFKEVVKVDFTVGSSAQLVPVAPCIPLGALINHRRQFSGSEAQLALWNQHY